MPSQKVQEIIEQGGYLTTTGYCEVVARALVADADFAEPLEAWPGKETKFKHATQPGLIAYLLIQALPRFEYLQAADIVYLYLPKDFSVHGSPSAGKMQRVSGPMHFLTGHQYLMGISYKTYMLLPPWQRVSLVYHELLHAEEGDPQDRGLRPHDFEGFMEELEVFGEHTFQRWMQMRAAFEAARKVDPKLAQRDFWEPAPEQPATAQAQDVVVERGLHAMP